MIVNDLDDVTLKRRLDKGLGLQIGPFTVSLRSKLPDIIQAVDRLYSDYPIVEDSFIDFHVRVERPRNLRRWIRPQAQFVFDTRVPFKPLPLNQAFAFFEWGLNWCVAQNVNTHLIFHSSVVEKNGSAILFPGSPGAGKSTLCAALVSRGWRLFSDEMAVLSLEDGLLSPVPRPISLKNESINIIKSFAPDMVLGPETADTTKGTVAHMKPPKASIEKATERVAPRYVVIPNYQAKIETDLKTIGKADTFMHLIQNSFNYNVLGLSGFQAATSMVDSTDCFQFTYSNLDDAIANFDQLAVS